jgi:hypothetical protein
MSIQETLSEIEVEQMMYQYTELMEELKMDREYLFSFAEALSEEEFRYILPDGITCVAQHFGCIVYLEKEIGKKVDMHFSFKVDRYDELFSNIALERDLSSLPSKIELYDYYHEVHDNFIQEIRFIRKAEVLFALINHDYTQLKHIRHIFEQMGKTPSMIAPASERVKTKDDVIAGYQYYLPAYTN